MNGRRGFMKCLVGAFVASAIELRLAREPESLRAPDTVWNPISYVGEWVWINYPPTADNA